MEINDINSRWKENQGDETYALQWAIDENSTVWEIGGFEGRWAEQIIGMYDPHMTIFEPTKWGFGKCSARFFGNYKVDVRHYGLWVTECALPLYNPGNDGASLLQPHAVSEVCPFKDVYDELDDDVDLCLMNVEGSEYVLLPYMIGYGLMRHIRLFWCQFHLFADPNHERFLRIHEALKTTHRVKWNFFPTAVAWERKE
jgi:hypothetical protein